MWNRRVQAIDLLGTTPRMPDATQTPPTGAARWGPLGFAIAVVGLLSALPSGEAGPASRWLTVMGFAAALMSMYEFGRSAWHGWKDDKVPTALACVFGVGLAGDIWSRLIGVRGASMRPLREYVPLRWLGYGRMESAALTALALAFAWTGLWLLRSVRHYSNRHDKAAAIVVTAASIALSWCVWLIVN